MTNDKEIRDKVRLLRNHGTNKRYQHAVIGYNSRLDNLQAAVLTVKLSHLDNWLDARTETAKFFNDKLKDLPLTVPFIPPNCRHTFHLYVLRAKDCEKIIKYLGEAGIESRTYYPIPLHLQECFKYLGYRKGDMPESEKLADEGFAIPVYPELTKPELQHIVDTVKNFF